MIYLLFVFGLVLLMLGANWLTDGALKLARRFGASDLAVGLTVVSIGTSVPELVVNIAASLHGSPDLAIGNILGSNVANVLLILGIAGSIRALPICDRTILSEIPICLAATLLVGFLANAHLFTTVQILTISRLDGLILLGFFALFLGYVYRTAQDDPELATPAPDERSAHSVTRAVIRIVGGVLALALGGEWVVGGAVAIAENAGVSESFVGLTVLALGTSAPELAVTVSAVCRGKTNVALGNIIGSNIFNLLWVLGVSAVIRPLPFDLVSNTDLVMVVVSNALLLLAMAIGRPNTIDRWEGWGFLVVYGAYLAFLGVRG